MEKLTILCLSVSFSDPVTLVGFLLHSDIKILNKEVRKCRKSEANPRAQDTGRKNLTKPNHYSLYSIFYFLPVTSSPRHTSVPLLESVTKARIWDID